MYLNAHSYYSLKYGTLSPRQLVKAAKGKGVKTLALTDINNTSCSLEFVRACEKEGIKPLLGIEYRNRNALQYIGLAQNNEGFKALNQLLTQHSLEGSSLPEKAPELDHAHIIYPFCGQSYKDLRDYEYIGIRPAQANTLFRSDLKKIQDKLVILSPVTFGGNNDFKIHKLLRAIDQNTLLSKLSKTDIAQQDEVFYDQDTLLKFYKDYPAIIRNTERLIEDSSIHFDSSTKNRKTFTGNPGDDKLLLETRAREGFAYRYPGQNRKAKDRLEKELQVIDQLGFSAYFLITLDIVRYAKKSGYYHVGRGSGANSLVAFCLQITDVDPIELDLYFERFINPKRTSPPDFDIDFSWDERDDVIDYVFQKYGGEHTALLATYNTFKGRSTVREVAKVFGLPKEDIDRIIKQPTEKHKHHDLADIILNCSRYLEGIPNYLSIHAGGILITEKPINAYTALQMMPKGFPIVHFDMHVADDFGFHKYDILSQRGLGHIKDAVDIIARNKGAKVDVHNIREIMRDEKVKKQLSSGKCMGCFYIESPAMRGLISKLRCNNYTQLVAASSVIRPGVAQSGMMREYIYRSLHPDDFEYRHATFKEHLGETYGVMVYQEDVIKIGHHFGGLDLSDADVLRRVMSGKRSKPGDLERIEEKYYANCRAKGYSEALAKEVWRQIESFAGYSFCKAHSATYAVESFQSLYLKTYFPLEFMVAVINNFGGFYSTEYYVHEARMCGAHIHAPCVNHSNYLTTIHGQDIYLGFVHLQGLESNIAQAIEKDRKINGPYKSLENFTNRVAIGHEQLETLIRIGAFRFTGRPKQTLMWYKSAILGKASAKPKAPALFTTAMKHFELPDLDNPALGQTFDEIELLGFPLSSPFALLRTDYRGNTTARALLRHVHKTIRMVGYYVCEKITYTKTRKRMSFGTWLDHEGHFFDTVHFPPCLEKYPLQGKGCYLIQGKVTEDFDFPGIEVEKMAKLPFVASETKELIDTDR